MIIIITESINEKKKQVDSAENTSAFENIDNE